MVSFFGSLWREMSPSLEKGRGSRFCLLKSERAPFPQGVPALSRRGEMSIERRLSRLLICRDECLLEPCLLAIMQANIATTLMSRFLRAYFYSNFRFLL
jgi:hypothetical protein